MVAPRFRCAGWGLIRVNLGGTYELHITGTPFLGQKMVARWKHIEITRSQPAPEMVIGNVNNSDHTKIIISPKTGT